MAIAYAGIEVGLREVVLKNKPAAMLAASSKGTVPVLIETNGRVIDESLDVMAWALDQEDSDHWLNGEGLQDSLIDSCDNTFKHWLDRYKYAVRFPEGQLAIGSRRRRDALCQAICCGRYKLVVRATLSAGCDLVRATS